MSTQKNKIKNPKLAKRTKESILAEVYLCKMLNWKIEFLSGGYESYDFPELVDLIKQIKGAYKDKLWLNIGTLNKEELIKLKPYIKGVSGAIECINPELRKSICPSKPLKDIEEMFNQCNDLNLKKSITIILGLGETIKDFQHLKDFITKHNIDQITFYRLKPQKNTAFENAKPIKSKYYERWIKLTRNTFPNLKIIVGSWLTHLDEISDLLNAGADGITKFPGIKKFNSKYAKIIENQVKLANMNFKSNLTKKPKTLPKINKKIKEKIIQYLEAVS
jgi:biotin synthase-like enzyme